MEMCDGQWSHMSALRARHTEWRNFMVRVIETWIGISVKERVVTVLF